ncbi:flippase [Acetivibrio straminisolvens]|uniref:Membrane protein n=1 Tax=Acetivibrio straminisolvens JCM 21531 TaxID=1294263 RepID=W4V808_9FIRM|nr:flippase [Acetivibrio straminisolvens]GAE88928.1 membrane protein [Acetivibrio straminisolvens JCM 21531]
MRKNVILMTIYEILVLILPFVTMPYVSRILGPEGVGLYAYSNSIVSYFVLISLLGIQLYGKREIAKVNHDEMTRSKVFFEIYLIQLIMSIISLGIYAFFILTTNDGIRTLLVIQLVILVSSCLNIDWFYFGIEKFKMTVTRNLLVKALSLVLIFVFIKEPGDLSKYVFIMSFSTFFSHFVMWFSLSKYVKRSKIDTHAVIKRFKPIVMLFIPVLAIQLFSIVDKTMLGLMADKQQVGFYENANRIARVPISIITSLGTVMLPRMTNLIANGQKQATERYIEKSLIFTMFLTFGCVFGIFGVADTFVPLFLGKSFAESASLVKVLSAILVFVSWGNVFRTQYILPKGMDTLYTKSVVYAAILNIILNAILIPVLQAFGAAIASVISEALICIYQLFKIRNEFKIIQYIKPCLKYLVSGMIMGAIVSITGSVLRGGAGTVLLQIAIGIFVYFDLSIVFEIIQNQMFIALEIRKVFLRLKPSRKI